MSSNWPFQIQSFLILFLLYLGVYQRRNRKLHVRIMLSAIAWDIFLVLQIELTRQAIAKASQVMRNPFLLNFHVTLAVTTLIFYGILVALGRKLLQGNRELLAWHGKLGLVTIVLRTTTLVTSFFTHTSP